MSDHPESHCPDCHVAPGETHVSGCDVERCSSCHGQWIGCDCEDHDPKASAWTGEWPGVVECRERGWYSVFLPERGECVRHMGAWWPCTADYPDAGEDLNRWTVFIMSGTDPFKDCPVLGVPQQGLPS